MSETKMSQEMYEVLEALCGMWTQYCGGSHGHVFMSAGERAMDVLEKYGLLKNTTICEGEVDYEKLEEYRSKNNLSNW